MANRNGPRRREHVCPSRRVAGSTPSRAPRGEASRPLGTELSYVENMGGAGGTVGAAAAAKAPADGYTFFVGAIHHAIAEAVYTKLTYDIEKDFDPVTVLAYVPNVIVMHPKHAASGRYAGPHRLRQGEPRQAQLRLGRQRHLAPPRGRALQARPERHHARPVQGRGADDAGPDRRATSTWPSTAWAPRRRRSRPASCKPLAVSTADALARRPGRADDQGDWALRIQVTTWYALWASKGTPKEIDRSDVPGDGEGAAVAGHQEDLGKQGAIPGCQCPAQIGRFVHSEVDRWGKVVRDAKIKIDNSRRNRQ